MASFVDRVVLHLHAGSGGNGCVSVRREKFKPLAGPDGGNGGHGGNIVLLADSQVTTLLGYHRSPHRSSGSGGAGMGDHRSGAKGEDLVLPVPVGTVVSTVAGQELVDLLSPGQAFVAAQGGQGGLGNAALASPKRKAPGFALLGTPGFIGDLVLELKTVADIALVGYPSAGKSSLIAALSAARPKIADYPFTTLQPNLGVVEAGDIRYTIADVPGLIKGASVGKGLGLEFLRHVERCTALVHVLDCATVEPGRDPVSDLEVLLAELDAYPVPAGQKPLLEREQIIALNKVDLPDGLEMAKLVRPIFEKQGYRVVTVSALSRTGLVELSFAMAGLVQQERELRATREEPARIVIRPRALDETDFTVTSEPGADIFRVRGEKPERWVLQTDFTNDEAVGFLADRLAKLGVEEELFARGALPGATVVIGQNVFDWEPTLSSVGELGAPRGTDPRLDSGSRPTRAERRELYHERMDAKAAARAELVSEAEAGFWQEQTEDDRDAR